MALLSMLGAHQALAATYTLPTTSGPFSVCTVSGSDETCPSNLIIGNSTTVTLAGGAAKPIHLSIGGDFTFGNNFSLNAGGNASDIDISVTNNMNPGNNAVLNANLSVGGSVNAGNGTGLQGNLVIGGNLNLGNNSSIQGNVQVNGALNIGNNVTITGDVSAQDVTIGNNTTINGNVTAADTVIIGNGSTVTGDVTAPHIISSGTIDGNKYCNDYNGQSAPCNGPPGPKIDHIQLSFTSQQALTCQPATVTIQACGDSGCTAGALYTGTVTATLSPSGYWVGGDTVKFSGGSGTAQLSDTTPGTVTNIGVASSSPAAANSTLCYLGATPSTCQITFLDSGFVFAVPNHAAGTTQAVTISAVAKDDATKKCIPAFQNVTQTVNFWSTYLNPNSGTQKLNVNGTAIAGASPGTGLSLNFNSTGDASLQVSYPDVGELRLDASFQQNGLTMTGQDSFVVRPDHFDLTNITCADGTPNPTVVMDATGPRFCRAGQDFKVTVSARNAADAVTPNYGKESPPESVALTSNLIAPTGGTDPGLTTGSVGPIGTDCSGNSAPGTACGTFSWPQVGIITLTAAVGDGDYLLAGNVASVSGNIGRFIPDHFALTGSLQGSSCSFLYMGEPFGLKLDIQALSSAGSKTSNYDDVLGFAKLAPATAYWTTLGVNNSLGVGAVNGTTPPLTPLSDRLALIVGSPAGTWSKGAATLTASFSFSKPTITTNPPVPDTTWGPYESLLIGAAPQDADGVTVRPADLNLDADADGTNERLQVGSTRMRYGRLKVFANFGPENEDITGSRFAAQYYNGSVWATNSDDNCTATTTTGISFCPAARIQNIQPTTHLVNGLGTMTITAGSPGESLDVCPVSPVSPTWLTDLSNCTTPDGSCGKITFGIYRGNDRIINWQEIQR